MYDEYERKLAQLRDGAEEFTVSDEDFNAQLKELNKDDDEWEEIK